MSEETNIIASEPVAESAIVAALREKNAAWVLGVKEALGELTLTVPKEQLVDICYFLKTAPKQGFNLLSDLCGADRGVEAEPRFEVNYLLTSIRHKQRVRLKVELAEGDARVPTVTGVWRTANWHERETFDLMGIIFEGHPDLRRILMPDDAVGHPLRKDYPLRGYEPYSLT